MGIKRLPYLIITLLIRIRAKRHLFSLRIVDMRKCYCAQFRVQLKLNAYVDEKNSRRESSIFEAYSIQAIKRVIE